MANNAGHMLSIESDRPATLQPIDLGSSGIAYVKSALAEGGRISFLVDESFGTQGTCLAPLEKGTTKERSEQFNIGTFMPTQAIRKWLADYITSQWGSDTQLMFADPWRKPSDFRRPQNTPYFFIENAPYIFPHDDDIYTRLTEGAKGIITHPFVAYVISPSVPVPPAGAQMGQDYAKLVAINTQAVLASAYDKEGYIIWQRHG